MSEAQVLQKGLGHCVSEEDIFRGSCAVVLLLSRMTPSFSERVGPWLQSGNSEAAFSC